MCLVECLNLNYCILHLKINHYAVFKTIQGKKSPLSRTVWLFKFIPCKRNDTYSDKKEKHVVYFTKHMK